MDNRPRIAALAAFTLVEMLVSIAVMALLLVMVVQLINGASMSMVGNRKHLDADGQARLIFDRMAGDFDHMVKRADVDYIFSTQPGNDALYFYSEGPALYDPSSTGESQSQVALVGYRVNSNYQLERLGKGLSWDGVTSSAASGGIVFLTYPFAAASTSLATPDPNSTLGGVWGGAGSTLGAAPAYTTGTDPDYHVLSDSAFRIEISFLLTDGTISTRPFLTNPPATWPASVPFYYTESSYPTVGSDNSQGFYTGAHWNNTSTNQVYVCMSAAKGAAVWAPAGIHDISAIIINLAILDPASRKLFPESETKKLASALVDGSSVAQSGTATISGDWNATVESPSFAQMAGVPQVAAGQVRTYQRYFYLNYTPQ